MSIFALSSVALRYPDAELLSLRDDFAAAVDELPPSPGRDALARFAQWWAQLPSADAARHYVEVFDLSRRTALDLTYPVFGDRRQRGLALLALKERYRDAGFEISSTELPDHLPLVLEFADRAGVDGMALIDEFRPQIEVLRLGLHRAETPYRDVLEAVCAELPVVTAEEADAIRRIITEGPPVEDVGLEPFAPPEVMPPSRRPAAPSCPSAGSAALIGAPA
jgi:nitrate reductase molybdenum cofactor assembly chaperone NarJ/NarW